MLYKEWLKKSYVLSLNTGKLRDVAIKQVSEWLPCARFEASQEIFAEDVIFKLCFQTRVRQINRGRVVSKGTAGKGYTYRNGSIMLLGRPWNCKYSDIAETRM